MHKREGVWESRYLPPPTEPRIHLSTEEIATCVGCGQEWRATAKSQFSPCCTKPRTSPGHPAQMLPPRTPLREPVAGDRLSRNGGRNYREVLFVRDGIVGYRCDKGECHCTAQAWVAWATGRTGGWTHIMAKIERRGRA